jgi:hypothetical protein
VTGSKANKMGKSFNGNTITIAHQVGDGVFHRSDFAHSVVTPFWTNQGHRNLYPRDPASPHHVS